MQDRHKFSYHTRAKIIPVKPKKSTSYVDITDTKTKETKRFQFSKNLGEGTYGYVRLFVNGDDKIAVKALKEDEKSIKEGKEEKLRHITKQEVSDLEQNMTSEKTLMSEAYPDQLYYWVGHYTLPEKNKNGFLYDCRMIQPFIEGKKLDDFAQSMNDPEELALLILRVAEELNRIHVEAEIIHGDAGARNILVKKNKKDFDIHFLDFGLAYRADGYAKVNYEKDSPSDTTSGDLAPERIPNRKLKARPAQDVYALAKTFRKLIKKRASEWQQDFYSKFPVIKNFIKSGIRDWKERPDLQEFIRSLQSSLDWKKNLPESLETLNQVNRSGDTVAHIAAEAGNISNIISLLKHHPDLSILNHDGLTAAEVAHTSIKPIMEFFTFLYDLENQTSKMSSARLFDNSEVKQQKKILKAAHWFEKYILTDDVDADEVENYQDIIDNSPELTSIHQFMADANWLRAENSSFSIFNF